MRLTDFLSESLIQTQLSGQTKQEVLQELVAVASAHGKVSDATAVLHALLEREQMASTGVGEEIAIPHAKLPGHEGIAVLMGVAKDGIDFDAVDELPVKLFFMVISNEAEMNAHLKVLARISRLVKLTTFKERVLAATGAAEMISILQEEEGKVP